jgi:hypothetical protein
LSERIDAAEWKRELIALSYETAQQGISRHVADITSTRNWCVTGVLLYYGTIVASNTPLRFWMCYPPLAVVAFAFCFTCYERGNAQVMKTYCRRVEKKLLRTGDKGAVLVQTIPLLERWLEKRDKGWLKKLGFYGKVACQKPSYWLWLVVLAVVIVAGTCLGQAATQGRSEQTCRRVHVRLLVGPRLPI